MAAGLAAYWLYRQRVHRRARREGQAARSVRERQLREAARSPEARDARYATYLKQARQNGIPPLARAEWDKMQDAAADWDEAARS